MLGRLRLEHPHHRARATACAAERRRGRGKERLKAWKGNLSRSPFHISIRRACENWSSIVAPERLRRRLWRAWKGKAIGVSTSHPFSPVWTPFSYSISIIYSITCSLCIKANLAQSVSPPLSPPLSLSFLISLLPLTW